MSVLDGLPLLAFNFGPLELSIFGLIVLLLFGTRLPSVMRSLGFGITEFKKGLKGEGPADDAAAIPDQRNDRP